MTTKKPRKHYSDEFKEEALKLAAKIVVAQSARENTLATESARLERQLAIQANRKMCFLGKLLLSSYATIKI